MFEIACFGDTKNSVWLVSILSLFILAQIFVLPAILDHALVAEATGRTPRVIATLRLFLEEHPGASVDNWVDEEARFMLGEFIKFVHAARRDGLLQHVHSFLRWFFSPSLAMQPPIGTTCCHHISTITC